MTTSDESGDFRWIDETLQGNVRSFGKIIEKYQDRVYTLVVRSIMSPEDAKDITQNVFYNAFVNIGKFRRECSLQTWLYRIAVNQVKNHWRNKKKRVVIAESELKQSLELTGNRITVNSEVDNENTTEEFRQLANDLISFLPLEQKQIFILFYISGHSCREIAEIFKTSVSNIKIQLFRGREYLYGKFKNIF